MWAHRTPFCLQQVMSLWLQKPMRRYHTVWKAVDKAVVHHCFSYYDPYGKWTYTNQHLGSLHIIHFWSKTNLVPSSYCSRMRQRLSVLASYGRVLVLTLWKVESSHRLIMLPESSVKVSWAVLWSCKEVTECPAVSDIIIHLNGKVQATSTVGSVSHLRCKEKTQV